MIRYSRRGLLRAAVVAALTASLAAEVQAQQPQWGPSRLPETSAARPISQAPPANQHSAFMAEAPQAAPQPQAQAANPNGEQLGSGVVLRWRSMAPTAASNEAIAQAARLRQQVTQQSVDSAAHAATSGASNSVGTNANPLRSSVMQVAYQQGNGDFQAPFGSGPGVAPPALPQGGPALPNLPGTSPTSPPQFDSLPLNQPDFNAPAGPATDTLPPPAADPLDSPELAPPPGSRANDPNGTGNSILENQRPSFPRPREDVSPADREPELLPAPSTADNNSSGSGDELKRRSAQTSSGYCDELRSRIRANPITAVSLDVSPEFGAGKRSTKDSEQFRLDFAAAAPVREWTDYRGAVVANGRMIDLRDGRVIIDAAGGEQSISMRDLSDVDTAYVGEAWNIPERCGTGYDPLYGRNFVPSTVQWAASGLCHKPLYFEQVQLERYGHEIGPVLQPIVSTAHFFGNIPLLPYKMGIHPPNECQYALGYYRPGNCAPYMIQPIPWSLRGAAVQAAAVTGAAALIP